MTRISFDYFLSGCLISASDEWMHKYNSIFTVVTANKQMRSTTNLLIINLAAADILFVIFCVPFTATDYIFTEWPFGDLWCKFVSCSFQIQSSSC